MLDTLTNYQVVRSRKSRQDKTDNPNGAAEDSKSTNEKK